MIKAQSVQIYVSYVCPVKEREAIVSVSMSQIEHYKISSMYDDVDDGCEIEVTATCPVCGIRHEIQLYKQTYI